MIIKAVHAPAETAGRERDMRNLAKGYRHCFGLLLLFRFLTYLTLQKIMMNETEGGKGKG